MFLEFSNLCIDFLCFLQIIGTGLQQADGLVILKCFAQFGNLLQDDRIALFLFSQYLLLIFLNGEQVFSFVVVVVIIRLGC
jgi:hypothetical protein